MYSLLIVSSASAGDRVSSSKPIRSTSSQCFAVPSAAADAVECEDTPLVDDAMPCHLDRQMSQDSIRGDSQYLETSDKPVLELTASSRKLNAILGGLISPPSS